MLHLHYHVTQYLDFTRQRRRLREPSINELEGRQVISRAYLWNGVNLNVPEESSAIRCQPFPVFSSVMLSTLVFVFVIAYIKSKNEFFIGESGRIWEVLIYLKSQVRLNVGQQMMNNLQITRMKIICDRK